MAGGGGRGAFVRTPPEKLAERIREAEGKAADVEFQSELATFFGELLGGINGRDEALVRERLDKIKAAMEKSIEGTIDQLFGGSVAKHTYVDGLSDVDSLMILNDTSLEKHTPKEAIIRI